MVAIVEVFNGAWFNVETPQVIAAAISRRSTTKLEASTVDPKCVRSPNFMTVQIKLTINAANNSHTWWWSGLDNSPIKKLKFKERANIIKNANITFSKFM